MADYNSSLPIRTQNSGDVVSKICDATTPSQQLAVGADGSINITDNGGSITVDGTVELGATTLSALESITVQNGAGASAVNIQDGGNSITVDATDLDIRDLTHVSDSVKIGDGTDLLAVNADGSINSVVTATDLDIRDLTAASDSVKSQLADGSGTYYSATNPIPVTITSNNIGDEINDYNTASAVASGATSNHDYTVNVGKTLLLSQIEAAGSGKMKIEVQVETAAASGVFNTKFVQFSSTANPNMHIELKAPISVATGVRVRIIRTNNDNQAQDLYSTICGQEV